MSSVAVCPVCHGTGWLSSYLQVPCRQCHYWKQATTSGAANPPTSPTQWPGGDAQASRGPAALISVCCAAPLVVVGGSAGAMRYECSKCGGPTDPKPFSAEREAQPVVGLDTRPVSGGEPVTRTPNECAGRATAEAI